MANRPPTRNDRNPYDLGQVAKIHANSTGWGKSAPDRGGYDLSRRDPYIAPKRPTPTNKK